MAYSAPWSFEATPPSLPFSFPAVAAKKVTAAFDGGRLTSNGGVMLLAVSERRLGLADNFWPGCSRISAIRRGVVHSLVDMFRARMFAICRGYGDANDLDHLPVRSRIQAGPRSATGQRSRSVFPTDAVAAGECSAPARRDPVIRLTYTLLDAWMDSYPCEPVSVTLDIDDTCDVAHGHQQLSLFNAHYDERCFLPIHDPRLRHGDEPARGGSAAAQQDATSCFRTR